MELQGKTITITGAGFIGLRMMQCAQEKGMKVKGLEISPQRVQMAEENGAQMFAGDVCNLEDAKKACSGSDIVFHTAAIVKEGGNPKLFHKVNVEGCRTMAKAAKEVGVSCFVHLSSIAVYGFYYPPYVSEEGPLRPQGNIYCETKLAGEQAVREFHSPGEMEVIVIRPGDVYGPDAPNWIVRPFELIKKGAFFLANNGEGIISHVYIDNLLDGVFLALEKEAFGEIFNVTDGRKTSSKEFFGYLGQMLKKKKLSAAPSWLLHSVVWGMEKGSKLLFLEPPAYSSGLGFLIREHTYSIEKAQQKLGYKPKIDLEQGMKIVEKWFYSKKML